MNRRGFLARFLGTAGVVTASPLLVVSVVEGRPRDSGEEGFPSEDVEIFLLGGRTETAADILYRTTVRVQPVQVPNGWVWRGPAGLSITHVADDEVWVSKAACSAPKLFRRIGMTKPIGISVHGPYRMYPKDSLVLSFPEFVVSLLAD